MKQRILSMFLVAVMVFTSVDLVAFAQEQNSEIVEETITEDEDIQKEKERVEDGTTASVEKIEEVLEPTEESAVESTEVPIEGPSVVPTFMPAEENIVEPTREVPVAHKEEVEEVDVNSVATIAEIKEMEDDTETEIIDSGNCGKNLTWTLGEDGVLTITGTGRMYDYEWEFSPWYDYKERMKKLVLSEGITSIGNNAFGKCDDFTGELIIPNSVTSIGGSAFEGCDGFTGELIIPNSVTSIGGKAFKGCDGFVGDLVIPDGVTCISSYTFYECSGFTGNLVIPNSVTNIGEWAFAECSGFTGDLVIPNSVISIDGWAFTECSGFTGDLVIPNSVTHIGDSAFAGCSGFTGNLVIPNSITNIESSVFYGCSGFAGDLVIPNSVTSIGDQAFYECSGFTGELTIPNSVTYIGSFAFEYCSGFTGDLVIPNSVTDIGFFAFECCSGFTGKLIISNSITRIEEYTFSECSGFTGDLVIPDSVTHIGDSAFAGCSGFTGELVIPSGVTNIGERAFADCSGLTGVLIISNSVASIGAYAFYACEKLESVTIRYGLERLEECSFNKCDSLVSVRLPASLIYIGFNAISNNDQLTIYGATGTYVETYAKENNITFVPKETETEATSVEVFPANPTVLKGYTKQMTLKVTPSDFTGEIVWESSDASVATVDQSGLIYGEELGTSQITVKVGNVSKQFTVAIVQPVTKVDISSSLVTIEAGESVQLSADVYPEDASNKECVWSSEDEEVATVNENGKVTGVSKGIAIIHATAKDGSGVSGYAHVEVTSDLYLVNSTRGFESIHPYYNNTSAMWKYRDEDAKKVVLKFAEETEVEEDKDYIYIYDEQETLIGKYTGTQLSGKEVHISGTTACVKLVSDDSGGGYGFRVEELRTYAELKPLERISLNEESVEMEKGSEKKLEVTYQPEDTTDECDVEWSSSDATVVTVDESGIIKAVGSGSAIVQAKVGQMTATCGVTVIIPLEEIEIATSGVELGVGDIYTLEVTYKPTDTTESKQVIWTSSNPTVATVDNNGAVSALDYGETIIECVSKVDKNVKDTCTIYINKYKVQFDSMGGSLIESVLCGFKKTLDCSEFIPERENYIFEGWYKDKNYQEKWTDKDIVLEDITLYAKWREAKDGFWLMPVEDQTYTGKVIKPFVQVYDGEKLLIAKTDYTVTYKNNIKPNDASKAKTAPTITVTGKGNYKGTETVTFKILKKDIAEADITVADITVAYSKKIQKKVPTIKRGSTSLKKDTDFTVSYPDLADNPKAYKAPGTYTILIKGKGGYTGQREVKLIITESKLMSKVTVSKTATQPYTGAAITTATMAKAPIVKYGDKIKLKEGIHYTVSYENNVKIGTATMTLTGTDKETPEGTFTGTKKVTFKIGGTSLAKATVTGVPKSMTYTGLAIDEQTENWGTPIKVVLNGEELTRAEDGDSEGDYIVTFKNNTQKGTATVTIKGVNAYSGSVKKEFVINAYNINDMFGKNLVTETMETRVVYAKGGSKPEPIVKFGETVLIKGKDYTLEYKNHTKWNDGVSSTKIPFVTIEGKGNFKGSVKLYYTIEKQNLDNLNISATDVVYKKEKGAYKTVPVIKDLNNKVLKNKTDFTVVSYTYGEDVTLKNGSERKEGEPVGKNDIVPIDTLIRVTVTGKGNYTNNTPLEVEYRVVKASVANAKVTIPSQPYTGKSITIEDKTKIKVMIGKNRLNSEDFEIVDGSFKNNIKAGTASFTIKGVGNYGGTKKVTFKIIPKGLIW